MRLFLAINIPVETKNILYNHLIKFQAKIIHNVKWVKKENWHITLKFFGEIEKKHFQIIKKKMPIIAENIVQQPINFSRVAAFPHLKFPRVIYLGIDKGSKELCEIYEKINFHLKFITSKKKENLYTPHITIGRVKDSSNIEEISSKIKKYSIVNFNNVSMIVNKISLMNSILRKDGPVYEEIYSVNLMER